MNDSIDKQALLDLVKEYGKHMYLSGLEYGLILERDWASADKLFAEIAKTIEAGR